MWKKISCFIISGALLMSLCGCFVLFAGAAGGTGTAVWLSGKLTQQVNAPLDKSMQASVSALKVMKLEVVKVTQETKVAQVKGKYSDGKTIWIDVHRLTDTTSQIEVRVGVVKADKEAATKILEQIKRYL